MYFTYEVTLYLEISNDTLYELGTRQVPKLSVSSPFVSSCYSGSRTARLQQLVLRREPLRLISDFQP